MSYDLENMKATLSSIYSSVERQPSGPTERQSASIGRLEKAIKRTENYRY